MSNAVEFIYKLQDKVSGSLKQMEENSKRLHDQMDRAKEKAGSLEKSLGRVAGRYLSFGAAIMGGRAILKLGMDMEQTRTKFEVMLGSLEKGNRMIADIQQLAKGTPYGDALTKSGETLLSFNYDVEKVISTLGMLGDVAMGDRNKLSGLTLAFAQMSSTGRLTGQDLLQMINQGFNPLAVISEKTGKSISVLKDEMAKGAISSQMVEEAFRAATSEGGRFHGMMDKMGQTGAGKLSTLMGTLKEKLAELGEKMVPYLNRVLDFGLKLADNFDRIAKVVWSALIPVRAFFTGLFTLFKFLKENGAVLAITATLLISIRLAMLQTALAAKGLSIGTMLASKAFQLLNATLLKNPFTAVLVGITLVVGALVMMRRRTREATSDLDTLNKRANDYANDERARLDRIFDALRRTNPESEERNKLIKQLKEMYPDLIGKMNLEKATLNELETAYNKIAAAIQKKAEAQAYESMIQELYTEKAQIETSDSWAALQGLLSSQSRSGYGAEQTRRLLAGHKLNIGGTSYNVDKLFRDYDRVAALNKRIGQLSHRAASGQLGGDSMGMMGFSDTEIASASSVSGLTGGGSRPTNITINLRNLIEYLNMYPQTVHEGITDMEDKLIEGLLRVVNSANRIAAR